jgi:hypothetical protein
MTQCTPSTTIIKRKKTLEVIGEKISEKSGEGSGVLIGRPGR